MDNSSVVSNCHETRRGWQQNVKWFLCSMKWARTGHKRNPHPLLCSNPPTPTHPPSQLTIPLSSAAFPSPLPLCSIAEISINAIQSCRAAANPIRTKIQIKYVKCCAGFCVSTSVYPVNSGWLVRNCIGIYIGILKGILWSFNSSFPSSLPLSISLCLSSRNQTSVLYLYRVCVCVCGQTVDGLEPL